MDTRQAISLLKIVIAFTAFGVKRYTIIRLFLETALGNLPNVACRMSHPGFGPSACRTSQVSVDFGASGLLTPRPLDLPTSRPKDLPTSRPSRLSPPGFAGMKSCGAPFQLTYRPPDLPTSRPTDLQTYRPPCLVYAK